MDFIDIFKHAYNILRPYSHIPLTLSYPKSAFYKWHKGRSGDFQLASM